MAISQFFQHRNIYGQLIFCVCFLALCIPSLAQPTTASSIATSASAIPANASAKTSRIQPTASPIQTQFKAYKVHFLANGQEELEPANSVSPGDVVAYVAQHRNVSQRRLQQIDFAIPIPWGTTLWQGSVQPAHGVLMKGSGDAQTAKTNPSKDQTRVVWRVERLDPGQSIELKLRVSIDADPALPPKPAPNPFRPSQPQLRKP